MSDTILRHFVYLNVDIVASWLEQLEGGRVQSVETVHESSQKLESRVSIISLLNVGAAGSRMTGRKETKTAYFDLYNRLESELRKAGKLLDFSANKTKKTEELQQQIFLASGELRFDPTWSTWNSFGYLFKKYNDWIGELTQGGQGQALNPQLELIDGSKQLVLPDNRPVVVRPSTYSTAPVLPTLPEEPPAELRALIKPEEIEVTLENLLYDGSKLKFVGLAPLRHFSEDCIGDLISGAKKQTAFVMGLINEIVDDHVRFTPIAVFAKL